MLSFLIGSVFGGTVAVFVLSLTCASKDRENKVEKLKSMQINKK